jgi:D-sedoheptulose 7-phosphate isomerase
VNDNMTQPIISQIMLRGAAVVSQLEQSCGKDAQQAAQLIARSLKAGGKVMFCGNGGSAGDSQHLAAEFVATLDHTKPRPGLAAIALTTDSSFITAYSNDFGFEGIFARQVDTLGKAGDVLVAISTSGNSKNVVLAAQAAAAKDITVIGMTGNKQGALHDCCDLVISAPSDITMHIQECHIALGHAITAAVEILVSETQE